MDIVNQIPEKVHEHFTSKKLKKENLGIPQKQRIIIWNYML